MKIGGDASQHSIKYGALEVSTLSDEQIQQLPTEGVAYPNYYRRLAKYRVRVVLKVPRRHKEGCPVECCHLKSGGDTAAAHAGWALFSPVAPVGGRKVCFDCLAPAGDWTDRERIAAAARRGFIYHGASNHVNIIGKLRALGKLPADTPDEHCPHCGLLITDAVEAAWLAKLAACEDDDERAQLLKEAAIECGGGVRGSLPVSPIENEDRAPSALHTRINVTGNCLGVTFLAVARDSPTEQTRRRALRGPLSLTPLPSAHPKNRTFAPVSNPLRSLLRPPQPLFAAPSPCPHLARRWAGPIQSGPGRGAHRAPCMCVAPQRLFVPD